MNLSEIAAYLCISLNQAKILKEKGILPGVPINDGDWEATIEEIDRWYIGLSGREWADTVLNGDIDPISVAVDLQQHIEPKVLLNILETWSSCQVIQFQSKPFISNDSLCVTLKISEAYTRGSLDLKNLMEDFNDCKSDGRILDQIIVAAKCEMLLGEQEIILRLGTDNILYANTTNDLIDTPQRDREIVRNYLADYISRLAQEVM